jgi:hypothetical protein
MRPVNLFKGLTLAMESVITLVTETAGALMQGSVLLASKRAQKVFTLNIKICKVLVPMFHYLK